MTYNTAINSTVWDGEKEYIIYSTRICSVYNTTQAFATNSTGGEKTFNMSDLCGTVWQPRQYPERLYYSSWAYQK